MWQEPLKELQLADQQTAGRAVDGRVLRSNGDTDRLGIGAPDRGGRQENGSKMADGFHARWLQALSVGAALSLGVMPRTAADRDWIRAAP